MTHHITDEQIDELCLSLTGTYTRKERDRAVARAVLALAAPAPAPAVPSHAEIEANIWPQLRLNGHPTLTLNDCIASIHAALTAAPTPPAQPSAPNSADDAQIRAIGEALRSAHDHIEMHQLERSHCKDAERIREGLAAFSAYRKRGDFVPSPAVPEDVARVNKQMLEVLKASRAYIARYGYTGKQLEIIDAAIDAARKAGGAA